MQFLRADSHLRAKAELASISKARGGIPINCWRIHQAEKLVRVGFVGSDDSFGVLRRIAIDMLDGIVQRRYDAYCHAQPQIFLAPILVCCRFYARCEPAHLFVSAQLNSSTL